MHRIVKSIAYNHQTAKKKKSNEWKDTVYSCFLVIFALNKSRFLTRMKKRSRKKKILKILLTITGTPIIVLGLLVTLLYFPPVQEWGVDIACQEISETSGYDIKIGSISLDFPLRLRVNDFKVSRNDSTYLQGKLLDTDISLLPLFTGKLEINNLSLENVDIDTRDIIAGTCINGKVGYARLAVRELDFSKSIANIRQLHIQEADIDITLPDTTVNDDTPMPQWVVKLYNGNIKDSRISLHIPSDSIASEVDIELLQLKKGNIDIGNNSFALERIKLASSGLKFDNGNRIQAVNPLKHIDLEDIALNAQDLSFSKNGACARLTRLTMEQPGGVNIVNATAQLTSENDTLYLKNLDINSLNGSYIHGEFIVPQQMFIIPVEKEFTASLSTKIDKRDIIKLVTPQVYDNLNIFGNELLSANIAMSGNIHCIELDTITLQSPGVGTVNGNGYVRDIIRSEKILGEITFNGEIDNIAKIADYKNYENVPNRHATTNGNIHYDNGILGATVSMCSTIGQVNIGANYSIADTGYEADVNIERLNLGDIIHDIPLHNLTMRLDANGKGFDIFNKETQYNISVNIDTLDYSGYKLRALDADAKQNNGISSIEIEGKDSNLLFNIQATTKLNSAGLDNHTTIELQQAKFKELGLSEAELGTSTHIDIAATSDLAQTHSLKLTGKDTRIITKQHSFTPESLTLNFTTSPKGTDFKLRNGDLNATGEMECGYNTLYASIDKVVAMYSNLIGGNRTHSLHDFEKVLPQMNMHIECGRNNMLHNYLAFNGIGTESMKLDLAVSPVAGLDITGDIYKFNSGNIELDSIKITTAQNGEELDYFVGVDNLHITSLEDENSYSATLNGRVSDYTATADFKLSDNISGLNNRLAAKAHLTPQLMSLCFDNEALVLGAPFTFNTDNYINIGKGMIIDANVLFKNSENSGFHLYTTPDATSKYNANLNIFNVELEKISNAVPGIPQIAGNLFAAINYQGGMNHDRISCGLTVDSLAYEGYGIGNEKVEFAYTSKNSENPNIDATLIHNNANVAHINSDIDFTDNTLTNGKLSMTRFPLEIANAFTNETGTLLNGYLNSNIDLSGTLNALQGQGYLNFDSTYVYIPTLGTTLHPSEENIMIEKSCINFSRFHLYDKANSPFVINGTVDIANPLNPSFNLRLNASNYEIINTPRNAGKSIYGKLSIDLRSFIHGMLNNLQMSGDLTILSNSNIAYILPETAFNAEKDLDGLVEFVNFNDTTSIVYEKLPEVNLGNINASLNITIKEGAKLGLDLDAAHENYVIFEGDGKLNATYSQNGFNVTGIYKLNSGDLKLTLPIIPLKTFHIQEGGRITWTGDLFNPTLDITALEKTTVSVEFDDNSIQPTTFYTGVVLGNTVDNIGIDFTMSSPDNMIQEQLNQLDKETLSKYAVAMIITGTYLGGRQGVTATSALSSFLDAKINDLSGEAIKNFDVNIGINDGLDAQTGSSYKNYSFSFSKRFLNDRITVVIGGEVNSGDRPDRDASNSSIINNVSLEWKLNESGNRYMKIFYDKNYRSILEGEITETGIGYVYKRKMNKLKELFNFKKKKTRKKAEGDTNQKESKR